MFRNLEQNYTPETHTAVELLPFANRHFFDRESSIGIYELAQKDTDERGRLEGEPNYLPIVIDYKLIPGIDDEPNIAYAMHALVKIGLIPPLDMANMVYLTLENAKENWGVLGKTKPIRSTLESMVELGDTKKYSSVGAFTRPLFDLFLQLHKHTNPKEKNSLLSTWLYRSMQNLSYWLGLEPTFENGDVIDLLDFALTRDQNPHSLIEDLMGIIEAKDTILFSVLQRYATHRNLDPLPQLEKPPGLRNNLFKAIENLAAEHFDLGTLDRLLDNARRYCTDEMRVGTHMLLNRPPTMAVCPYDRTTENHNILNKMLIHAQDGILQASNKTRIQTLTHKHHNSKTRILDISTCPFFTKSMTLVERNVLDNIRMLAEMAKY